MGKRDFLLTYTPLPEKVQLSLVGTDAHLAWNRHLSAATIEAIIKSKPSADEMLALLKWELSEELLDLVIRTEKRTSVLEFLCERHWTRLNDTQRTTLCSKAKGKLAVKLARGLGDQAPDALVANLTGADRLEHAARRLPALGDLEVLTEVLEATQQVTKRPSSSARLDLEVIAHARPDLIEPLAKGLGADWLGPLAGALTLPQEAQSVLVERIRTESLPYVAMALAANPVATDETREALSEWATRINNVECLDLAKSERLRCEDPLHADEPTLANLVRRSLPSQWKPSGRPVHLAHLSRASNISVHQLRLQEEFTRWDFELPVWYTNAALASLHERCGAAGEPPKVDHYEMRTIECYTRPTGPTDPDRVSEWSCEVLPEYFSAHGYPDSALWGLVEKMGDEVLVWDTLLALADNFPGTLGELYAVAAATNA